MLALSIMCSLYGLYVYMLLLFIINRKYFIFIHAKIFKKLFSNSLYNDVINSQIT